MPPDPQITRSRKKLYFAFLDKRIPQLHKDYPGRKARIQADREWAQQLKADPAP